MALGIVDLTTDRPSARVVLRALASADVEAKLSNGRVEDRPDGAWESCGRVGVAILRGGEPVAEFGRSWGESRGHGLVVARGGAPVVVESALAFETLTSNLAFDFATNGSVVAGDLVVLDLRLGGGPESLDRPSVAFRGPPGAFEVVSRETSSYACGAGIHRFSGDVVASGFLPAPFVVAREASVEVATHVGTSGALYWEVDPRTAGACRARGAVDGETLAEAGVDARLCELAFDGPPGTVRLTIEAGAAVGPVVLYEVWDGAPVGA